MTETLKITPESVRDQLQKESNGAIHFRPALQTDIPALVRVVNAAYMYENAGENAFRATETLRTNSDEVEQEMNDGIIIVAANPQNPGEIMGCIQYTEIPPEIGGERLGYFGMFAVDPSIQSKGIGGRLMQTVENIAVSRGINTMQIQVVSHSTHLLDWYSSKGYLSTGRVGWEASYLTKPTEFVIMQKNLQAPGQIIQKRK